MLYLILAVVSAAANGIIFKLSQNVVKSRFTMLMGNYIVCLALALFYLRPADLLPQTEGLGLTLAIGLGNGALFLGGFVLMQYCTRTQGVVLTSVFAKLGLLVPIALSLSVFGEQPTPVQVLGFVLAVAAILLMNLEKGSGGVSFTLILLLLLNGSCDGMAKVYEEVGTPALSEHFLVYSFFFALVFNVFLVLWKREKPGWRELLIGFALGVPNYYVARFLLKAVAVIPAVIVYPTYSVGSIVLATLAGVLLFKEPVTKKQGAAISVILLALVLLNI